MRQILFLMSITIFLNLTNYFLKYNGIHFQIYCIKILFKFVIINIEIIILYPQVDILLCDTPN